MNNMTTQNPFNITKAVDFSDDEINKYWVELSDSSQGGFFEILKPTSPMPMLILGGKGSGKTHIMRYFSYSLQKKRIDDNNLLTGLAKDKYIGIYSISSGMNAGRFKDKGYPTAIWNQVFEYHMEIWFSLLLLDVLIDLSSYDEINIEIENTICQEIYNLFDRIEATELMTFVTLKSYFTKLKKNLDFIVNNCSMSRNLESLQFDITRGNMIFGIPKIICKHIKQLEESQFLYLIDELENFDEEQQKYIQTLIRERQFPTSFKIGARLYGIKTYKTYSAGEINKAGSEFDKLILDEILRSNKKKYTEFSKKLIAKRIFGQSTYDISKNNKNTLTNEKLCIDHLPHLFETIEPSKFEVASCKPIIINTAPEKRRHFVKFSDYLKQTGVNQSVITTIIKNLSCNDYPLVEKFNIHEFYKQWKRDKDLIELSEQVSTKCEALISGDTKSTYSTSYGHFKKDLLAQLRKDYDEGQKYIGLDCFISMSGGLPKNLLLILKFIFSWAMYRGENILHEPISIKSQQKGVLEASNWFHDEPKSIWTEGKKIKDSIERICRLFKEIRFSDKPSECSVITFCYDSTTISHESKKLIKFATQWSLFIDAGLHRDKNKKANLQKIQLNPLLSPRWDLAISRRGTITLSTDEINAIFDPQSTSKFEDILKTRISRMTAPYFGGKTKTITSPNQHSLLDFSNNDD